MDTAQKERLIAAGLDIDEALERLLGSEALLKRLLQKFLTDSNFDTLQRAVAAQDWETALTASHTLKGICGNLSLNRLFALLTRQVSAFRAGEYDTAAALMEDISAAYETAVRAVQGEFL